jgi:hypothetical protein
MICKFSARLLAGAICASLSLSAAPAQQARQPVGKWVVDFAEENCSASRAYGPEGRPLSLSLRLSPGGNVVRLVIARPGRRTEPHHFPVRVNALPGAGSTTALRFTSSNRQTDLIWVNVERAALDRLRQAGTLTIKGKGIDESIKLPGFAAVVKTLDRCVADLRAYWNADAAGAARLARPAEPLRPLASYVSARDYPAQAIREDVGGLTAVTMMIDEQGAPKECMVEQTSGIASLDVMACAVFLERAKFKPAVGVDGKPARSVLNTRIRWVAP